MSKPISESSDEFRDAICHGGSCWVICEFCGKNYGEDNGDTTFSIGMIEGKQMVWSCRCPQSEERLSKVENFLVGNRRMITDFYRLRIKALKEDLRIDETLLEGIES